jgi:hypothetical protein
MSVDYTWDDGGILGEFSFKYPNCGFQNDNDGHNTYDLEDPRVLVCEKCSHKYRVRRKTFLEELKDGT